MSQTTSATSSSKRTHRQAKGTLRSLRTCQNPRCEKLFTPVRPSQRCCSWECHLFATGREGKPLYDAGYREGYAAGLRAGLAKRERAHG